jgi:hypothetical protein
LEDESGLQLIPRAITKGKWGEIDYVNAGIEGYGWGGLNIFLLIRSMMGLQEEEADVLTVAPVLPRALRHIGATYKIGPLPWGKHDLHAGCVVKDMQSYSMQIDCSTQQWAWEGAWGEGRKIVLPVSTHP